MFAFKSGQTLITLILFFLPGFFLCRPACPLAAETSANSFSGICERPLPAVEPTAYMYCRADAWLGALKNAAEDLPPAASRRLWEMDLTGEAVKMALAALIYPLGASTPDISASREIRVFLEKPDVGKLSEIFANSEKLFLEIALQDEMRATLEELRKSWPRDLVAGDKAASHLNAQARLLDALWQMASGLAGEREPQMFASPLFRRIALENSPASPLLLLILAKEALDSKMPQKALHLAAGALEFCEKRLLEKKTHKQAWHYIFAYAMYLRGLAHWQLNQNALAQNDFDKAETFIRHMPGPFLAELTLARAKLFRQRGHIAKMCGELEKACALGLCSDLAEARRRGSCSGNGQS